MTNDINNLELLNHGARERLAFIDFSLQYFGHISRAELTERFKTGLAASTRDFATYKDLAPGNLTLNHTDKRYYRCADFVPVFQQDPEAILHQLCQGFGNGISTLVESSEVCLDAVRLIHPNPDIIAGLMRAITNQQAIKCGYVSVSSGETERELVPHAMVNNGHRWHVRAFDRHHQEFRDFVCTRFTTITELEEVSAPYEQSSEDKQWNTMVDLHLIPHPEIGQTQAVEMDYNMVNGELNLKVRAALASYVLRQWQVDCSADHRIKGQGCQLALANPETLIDVENMRLAPGFGIGMS
ncbi:WYL domain-containing protein [Planctobacterium marinum]|uniref:WYL domain-containing protein n=1 Tax=Planctobacterium marinum TaxID=1631968 RepID=A0AA48HM90_9ALTE|nr:WYL domain-containing protein [Planctobacterium marinum]